MDKRKLIPVVAMIGVVAMLIWGFIEGTFEHSWIAIMIAGIVIVAISIVEKDKEKS